MRILKNVQGLIAHCTFDNYIYVIRKFNILDNQLIEQAVRQFFSKKLSNMAKDSYAFVLLRIRDENNIIRTLGNTYFVVNTEASLNNYIDYMCNILALKNEGYKDLVLNNIIFSYGIRAGALPSNHYIATPKDVNKLNYKHYNLPISLLPSDFGNVIDAYSIEKDITNYSVHTEGGNLFKIKQLVKDNLVTNSILLYIKGLKCLSWTDTQVDKDTFIRTINKNKYIYKLVDDQWKLDIFYVGKPTKYFTTLKKHKNLDQNILTGDIETYVSEGDGFSGRRLVPYLISFYDGVKSSSFYLADFKSPIEMLEAAFNSLLTTNYNKFTLYFHNLAGFDSNFIMEALLNTGDVQVLINKGKLISIKYSKKGNKNTSINLLILDSLQMLPVSLDLLSKSFKVESPKGIFPHSLVGKNNLNYEGLIPHRSYFFNLDIDSYMEYCDKFTNGIWNLKKEAIKYCQLDCISLHQVLIKYSNLIFNNFQLNITKFVSLPSLAFAIFRSNFLDIYNIPQISGDIFNKIAEGYTGGAVDMYIPSSINKDSTPSDNTVYSYDINSLYPFVMSMFDYPVGQTYYFEGNVLNHFKDKLGFYYCEVTAPKDIKHPIIQRKVVINDNKTTASTTGTFHTVLYSEELANAIKYGYKFKIISGIFFEGRASIFSAFVKFLYNLRLQYPKGDPMNLIAKLLLNSSYGRLGMKDNFGKTKFYNKDKFNNFINRLSPAKLACLEDVTQYGEDHYLVQTLKDLTDNILDSDRENHYVNVALAAAITAEARIFMSQFKNREDIKLYYTDTDSIFINLSPEELNKLFLNIIGNGLGQLKLEYIIDKAVFLGPKAYCLKLDNGDNIVKIKGLPQDSVNKSEININHFFALLFEGVGLDIKQTKMVKAPQLATITLQDQVYNLKQNSNKRIIIYNEEGFAIGTESYCINDKKNNDN